MKDMCLTEKVEQAVSDYSMLQRGDVVVAALSGGADSVSLLCALKALEDRLGITVAACHVNHNLRGGESDADMRFCEELCNRLGVKLHIASLDILSRQQKHESVEETARKARYEFFGQMLEHYGDRARLATAHNSGDNAETVLLNLMRGTGLKGLCGIPPVRDGIIRPLIYCSRREVEEYLESLGQGYCTDRTNLSDDYTRNRVRHNIIPEMERINPSLEDVIARMGRILREDNDLLESMAQQALEQARTQGGWSVGALSVQPRPILTRAVKSVLSDGGVEPSALRINMAVELILKGRGRVNLCKDHFFTVKKGVAFVEKEIQQYRKR